MMADVPRWKRRIWMDASGEEAVPQGLAGDDSDARPPSLREDLLDPFLTQQAKRDLERLRFPGLETQKRLDGLVDGNPVVLDLVLPFQCVVDLVRGRVRHQFRGRVVQLIEVHVVRAESLQGSIQGEREVARVEVHPNASAVKVSADLRRQEHLFPAAFEGLSEDFLTVAQPYTSAVSKKLTPRSTALRTASMDSVSFVGPYEFPCAFPPIAHAPKPISDTSRPVRPSGRRCTGARMGRPVRTFSPVVSRSRRMGLAATSPP